MDKIIVAVDLGHFRAYRVKEEPIGKGKIELLESYDSLDAHGKILDKVSDQAGRFKFSGQRGGIFKAKGYGEPHAMQQETERKRIRDIAHDVASLLTREDDYDSWFFAAAEEIHNRVLANIPPNLRSRMGKHLVANLTNVKKLDIVRHFEAA